MAQPPLVVLADRQDHGQTLAAVLKSRLGLSWSQAKRVIDRRHVRVAGQIVADAAYRVKNGKRITVAGGVITIAGAAVKPTQEKPKPAKPAAVQREAKPERKPIRPPVPLDILFSDESLVVVNKPAGFTTVRSTEDRDEFGEGQKFLPKTLAELLPAALGAPDRPVVAVHRLDRGTSGVIVFARKSAVAQKLMTQFRKHTSERRYLALVRGTPKAGRIESTFVADRGDGRRGSGSGEDARKAVTMVKVLEQFENFALIECMLETGRTHQVRIHLGEAGTPLCGEKIYDRPINGRPFPDGSGAKRPMLHAARLGFTHPVTNERLTFEVAPPADFAQLLEQFRYGS